MALTVQMHGDALAPNAMLRNEAAARTAEAKHELGLDNYDDSTVDTGAIITVVILLLLLLVCCRSRKAFNQPTTHHTATTPASNA